MVVESQDVTMKPKLIKECKKGIEKWCSAEPHGDAQVLDCLVKHKNKKDDDNMPKSCRDEIMKDDRLTSVDHREPSSFSH